jgi:dolichol-phosphate mannosyltransferase/undecaprenyl-phosphate 4-deoxy-4-formamido-L-arabinose transferase
MDNDNRKKTNLYSIVIPVYNSTQTLVEISERVDKVFRNIIKENYEIIFVDDGSYNGETWKALTTLVQNNKNASAIQLTRNFGQVPATLCGMKEAKGDIIITMDDDLEHLPEDIPKLIAEKEHDIVMGQFPKSKHGFFRGITSKIKDVFDCLIVGKPKNIQMSAFRLISRTVIDGMISIATPFPMIAPMMFYFTKDVFGVNLNHESRKVGKSGYNFFKRLKLFTNLLINNSSLLLRLIGYLGIGISFTSFFLGLFLISQKIFGIKRLVGWTSVIVTVLFIGGLLLFSVGILGEYLIRIIQGTEKKPTYFIRKKLKNEAVHRD